MSIYLAVNEIYGPVKQGEGKSLGREVIFIRLAGCNLACGWCDTPYTWNWIGTNFQHPDKFDPKVEVHKIGVWTVVKQIQELAPTVKSVVISGGEPMLQQEKLVELIRTLKSLDYWVEVETNGTIAPIPDFLALVDQINCSPKLKNSGIDNPLSKREVPNALQTLSSSDKTNFKFVVTGQKDLSEILSLVNFYSMKDVYLMPEGTTKKVQEERSGDIEALCLQYGFHFSPRLHVIEFGNKRGV